MLSPKDLDRYRRVVEAAAVALGRDDIGVNVEDGGDGLLAVTFSRGTRAHTAQIPVDALQDAEHARIAINGAVLALSKAVAQEAVAKATQ